WGRVDDCLAVLSELVKTHPGNEEIALTRAQAAVNVSSKAGDVQEWGRVDDCLAVLSELVKTHPGNEEIALRQAKAAFNVSIDAGAVQEWGRVDDCLAVLSELVKSYPGNEEILGQFDRGKFQAAVKPVSTGLNACDQSVQDYEIAQAMLDRVRVIIERYPGLDNVVVAENEGDITRMGDGIAGLEKLIAQKDDGGNLNDQS
ncbi:MAG: hypothetical protein JKY49_15810, partial [Cohaesibacteraceae bacterium]|nr:hypothetical protein [Cohaesibacteraceae bacterium]